MATLLRKSKSLEDIQKELSLYGESNFAVLKDYAVVKPVTPINDEASEKKSSPPLDIPQALSLHSRVKAYEKSNFFRRLWYWAFTDISQVRQVYYYARAASILDALNSKQFLSTLDQQFITEGVRQNSTFSTLGKIYRGIESNTQRALIVRPDPQTSPFAALLFANKILPKPGLFSTLLYWIGFGRKISPILEVNTTQLTQDPHQNNPLTIKHAEFKKQFQDYKTSLENLLADLNQQAPNKESLQSQLNDLVKKERKLRLMTHPDKNIGACEAIATANFQRLEAFIQWKTDHLEKLVNTIENGLDPIKLTLLTPMFNAMNKRDENQHTELEKILQEKHKTGKMVEEIKRQAAMREQMEEAERKVYQEKFDARVDSLLKMARSLRVPANQRTTTPSTTTETTIAVGPTANPVAHTGENTNGLFNNPPSTALPPAAETIENDAKLANPASLQEEKFTL